MTRMKKYQIRIGMIRDPKVRAVMKEHGYLTVSVLIALNDMIFKGEGYYIVVDDGFYEELSSYAFALDKTDAVQEIVKSFVSNGLFDKYLFYNKSILTSHDIQERFISQIRNVNHQKVIINPQYKCESDVDYVPPKQSRKTNRRQNKYSSQEVDAIIQKAEESCIPSPEPKQPEANSTDKLFDVPLSERDVDYVEIIKTYRAILGEFLDRPSDVSISPQRRGHMRARDKDLKQLRMTWADYFNKIKESDFLCGRVQEASWKADFSWILNPNNFHKILAGNYDNGRRRGVQSKYSGLSFEKEIERMREEMANDE